MTDFSVGTGIARPFLIRKKLALFCEYSSSAFADASAPSPHQGEGFWIA